MICDLEDAAAKHRAKNTTEGGRELTLAEQFDRDLKAQEARQ